MAVNTLAMVALSTTLSLNEPISSTSLSQTYGNPTRPVRSPYQANQSLCFYQDIALARRDSDIESSDVFNGEHNGIKKNRHSSKPQTRSRRQYFDRRILSSF